MKVLETVVYTVTVEAAKRGLDHIQTEALFGVVVGGIEEMRPDLANEMANDAVNAIDRISFSEVEALVKGVIETIERARTP